ncbi:MAG: YiiD C-terminal domain-containing protein [Leptospiraceae bacterium]
MANSNQEKSNQEESSEKNSRSGRLSFEVHPLWRFLQDTYGFEESFDFFGPYRGASIRPRIIDDYTIEVRMPLELSNTNYVGTQFGGSLYSMCDPFYMALLIRNLGPQYMVWDKGASIDFIRPGTGEVHAVFHISREELEEIKRTVEKERKSIRHYEVEIKGEQGEVVALVKKELYVRKLRASGK